jgi:AAA family ATP:ADP antiporter
MSKHVAGQVDQDSAMFEWRKTVLISIAFALIIGAYTVILELKNSIFVHTVGIKSIPTARILSMFVLIPFIFLYSRLVDKLRRYYLVSFYCILYGLLGLLFAYFFGHPTIGIPNTEASPYRLFGWIFYFFVESYPPFVVSVFWAFVNSVSSPDSAKKNYALIVAASKLGGMFASGFAGWWLLRACSVSVVQHDTMNHQLLLSLSSMVLLLVPLIIFAIIKYVPGKYLHGYEAVYKFEKKREKLEQKEGPKTFLASIGSVWTSMTSGLTIFAKQPYVLGIFGMVFLYEVVYVVFSWLRIAESQRGATSLSAVTNSLFSQIFIVHCIGFVLALVGTKPLLRRLGERYCIMLIPVVSGIFLIYLLVSYSPAAVSAGFIALRAINYAFSQPIRESLYIPTTKDLKFKSKSWIDAFGSKFAKSTGSVFNMAVNWAGPVWFMSLYASFFACILSLWFMTAYLLGRRFERAIANNEVIGAQEEEPTVAAEVQKS